MTLDKKEIDNLYVLATSPKLDKKIHHRYVPMMMYTEDGKEVVLPMVIGTSRDMREIEELAEKDTKLALGDVMLSNRGSGSSWKKIMDNNRSAYIVYYCVRMPGELNKKFFENKQQVEDTYDPDELGILMDHYATVRFTQPHYVMLNSHEDPRVAFQEAIDKVKSMGEESDFFLNSFTTHSVNQLIKFLVFQLVNLENTIGGSGLPSSNTTKIE